MLLNITEKLNLFNDKSSLKYLNDLYIHARNRGLKSTYYLRNKSASEIEKATITSNTSNSDTTNSNDDPVGLQACSVLDPTCESCQWLN